MFGFMVWFSFFTIKTYSLYEKICIKALISDKKADEFIICSSLALIELAFLSIHKLMLSVDSGITKEIIVLNFKKYLIRFLMKYLIRIFMI